MTHHPLQHSFAPLEGETAWLAGLRHLAELGDGAAIEAQLVEALATLDSDLARMCLDLAASKVRLSGWQAMVEAIEEWEGDPVTGVAIGFLNDPDAAFDKEGLHRPELTYGVYCDGDFAWSQASNADLLEAIATGAPEWAGTEEDIELFLAVDGLEWLNTALLRHKHRHFFRDGDPELAPRGYVEFVLASWFRALRFHQAVATEQARLPLPNGARVLSGLIDMRPDVAMVHGFAPLARPAGEEARVETASLLSLPSRLRGAILEEEPDVSNIRQKVARNAPPIAVEEQPQRLGFFARLFGRRAA